MGWASGSILAEELWDSLRRLIPSEHHRRAACVLIDLFESQDCDTINECEQLMDDAGYPWDGKVPDPEYWYEDPRCEGLYRLNRKGLHNLENYLKQHRNRIEIELTRGLGEESDEL